MILWDTVTGKQLFIFHHERGVICCAFSHDAKYLVSGGQVCPRTVACANYILLSLSDVVRSSWHQKYHFHWTFIFTSVVCHLRVTNRMLHVTISS